MTNRDPIGLSGVIGGLRTDDETRVGWSDANCHSRQRGGSCRWGYFQGNDVRFRSACDLLGQREESGWQPPRVQCRSQVGGPRLMKMVKSVGANASPVVNRHGNSSARHCTRTRSWFLRRWLRFRRLSGLQLLPPPGRLVLLARRLAKLRPKGTLLFPADGWRI